MNIVRLSYARIFVALLFFSNAWCVDTESLPSGPVPWAMGQAVPALRSTLALKSASMAPQLYPLISGTASGPAIGESPDPLIRYRWKETKGTDDLQIYFLSPVATWAENSKAFPVSEILLGEKSQITVAAPGSIRFDFGVESAGWLEFDSSDCNGLVEMSISEYNEVPRHPAPVKTKAAVKHGNTYRLELNDELYEGLRFGWIHVRSLEKPWHITAVRLVCQAKPANYEGSFSCSDPLLTRIWYTAAYGVRLNLLKEYFATLLMDRGDRQSWTGDAHPAQAAALVAFGNWDFIKQNLERTSPDSNGIESYSLYWILSLMDYYRYTGDTETMSKYLENVATKLTHGETVFAKPVRMRFYGWDERLGSGFETPDNPESQNAYRGLYIRACREFAWAAGTLGKAELSKQYLDKVALRTSELRKDQQWWKVMGVHALADAVNGGVATAEEQKAMYERDFSNRLTRLSLSPFNQYFILQAMAAMGYHDDALGAVYDCWGSQIAYGATTSIEVYRPSWNAVVERTGLLPNSQAGFTSYCHAWGGGATKWLTEEIAGIKPTTPGFATVDILPCPGRRLTSVSAAVPTLHGLISSSMDVKTGTGETVIPSGVTARIGVPKVGKTISTILLNGKIVWDGKFQTVVGLSGAEENAEFVFLKDVQPGSHKLQVTYAGKDLPPFVDRPFDSPVSLVQKDTTTGGNWGGKYGKDGYVLLSYNGIGKDRDKKPAYVSVVKGTAGTSEQWASDGKDTRILAPDPTNLGERVAGFFRCNVNKKNWNTTYVDIQLPEPKKFLLTIYALDFDRQGRRQAYEIMDYTTHALLAPVQIADAFGNGVYHTFECDRSVRIRIIQLRGDNVGLSGVFFDPSGK